MSEVKITETERGFHEYGDPITCTYGNTVRVTESSAAAGPHVWLFVDMGPQMHHEPGRACLHLDEEQARQLVARLQAWWDEIPDRWCLPGDEEE